MSNRITKRSRNTYISAIAAIAARPAYCVTTTGYAVKYIAVRSLSNAGVDTAPGYPTIVKYHLDPFGRRVVDEILIPIRIANSPITVCYPAVPGVPGREAAVQTDGQVGWNAGGRSIEDMPTDFLASFNLPTAPGGAALCGIASSNAPVGSFESIEHGVYTAGGAIRIYESGNLSATLDGQSSDSPLITIQRVGEVITYSAGSSTYVSAKPSSGTKRLASALYAAGDYIENPTVITTASGSSFAPLSLGNDAASSYSPISMAGSAYGRSGTTAIPEIALDGIVSVFDMEMAGLDHAVFSDAGVLSASMTPTFRASEEFQAGIRFVIDDPHVDASDTSDLLSLDIFEGLITAGDPYFTPVLYATISESLSAVSFIEVIAGIDARLSEMLLLSSPVNANLILETILRANLTFSDNAYQARNDALYKTFSPVNGAMTTKAEAVQYVTNLSTGAVTRYTGYSFSAFCRVGQDLYATRPDGLYKIGASTDNSDLFSCLVDFAADELGTKQSKRLENIFFGISSDGRAYARLEDDFGRQFNYRLIQRDSSEARIDTAKGASSRFWKLRLEIEDATYADIDNIEWVQATGSRRTKR